MESQFWWMGGGAGDCVEDRGLGGWRGAGGCDEEGVAVGGGVGTAGGGGGDVEFFDKGLEGGRVGWLGEKG